MVAKELIDNNIPLLKPSDNVDRALQLMSEYKSTQLPFCVEGRFEGFYSEDLLLHYDYDILLEEIQPEMTEKRIEQNLPLLELVKIFANTAFDILPITDSKDSFLGCVSKTMVFEKFIETLALNDIGGILEINLENKEYSMSEISRIVEHESAKILSSYIVRDINNQIHLTLKLDISQISGVVSSLERYGYEVASYHTSEPVTNIEKDRYDLLMKYLSI